MDFLIEALTEWAREVEMSYRKEDHMPEPTMECKNCGEVMLTWEADKWGYCPQCATNEDEEDYDEGDDNEATD